MDIKKIRKYVDESYGITCAALSDTDVIKLAKKYLLASSLETPMIAKAMAKILGLTYE